MPTKTETLGPGAFIKSEGNGDISRDTLTVVSGAGSLIAGTVLGKITSSGKYKPYDNDASDGSEVAAAILVYDVDATSADKLAVGIVREAEVFKSRLVWGAGVTTDAEKTAAYADLAAKVVIAR